MVTKYPIPGVYLEEVSPKPVSQFRTGVPAFLGFTNGDINKPKMLNLWTQFEDYFTQNPTSPHSYLSYAVRGFFENGGHLCYVVSLGNQPNLAAFKAGLAVLESFEEIDLICAPDIMVLNRNEIGEAQTAIIEHCEKLGDRFAILDPENVPAKEIQKLTSDYAAIYAPWLKVKEAQEYVPPCGYVAGIYAKSDRTGGIHQSPANYILEGVLDLSFHFTNDELQYLNPQDEIGGISVNCIRALMGRGIRIWGTRTLSQDPNWRYINVRRLFINVHRWIERNLADVVFEPNDIKLWVRIERELNHYFESLFQEGALKGRTTAEAFYVKCDAETNPPELLNSGQVVTEIGLAPVIPSEFIVIRLIHGASGVTIA
ncbi:MAG TPA: phage tail sheath family protein [Cyanobacteria bacterium UBA11149]|nr:phage tail sheath family protein [Cyanobacteria bacterium UBA11367]HBE57553.1 phage tail sheath family protein [Cyanobacteria bacterium UBA11366]HBK62779.1 phage tail sheath family protein [Cyanobacteria bacterium UBA11166]HBR73281.1 phage tail sheath family protein [Cyanobacteria bacterium UBA11159]HBS67771.1 phage tail sheath family protein [Cyanobacteria bacterium UBA11153]HBW92050.1 phage tail sheath family protein [Cyanobacteria bacterium UBA11149]HCA97950.1 phage tail sheath family p